MRKSELKPGQITSAKNVNDRVNTNVSSSASITVSETGLAYLKRTQQDRPSNEEQIRNSPLVIHALAAQMLEEDEPKAFKRAIERGLLVVI